MKILGAMVRCPRFLCLAAWCAAVLTAGCAGTEISPGLRLLEAGQPVAALEALRAESASHPDDPLVQRDLAAALLESGRAAEAAVLLRRVRTALPREAAVAFLLGRACEQSGDLEGALAAYRDYLARGGRGKDEVAARLQAITQRRIEVELHTALAHEDSIAATEVPENTVAVPDFTNPAWNDSLSPLGRGLAALLITDLSRVEALRVVERARLRVLLDELDLARTPAVTPPESDAPVPAPAPAPAPVTVHEPVPVPVPVPVPAPAPVPVPVPSPAPAPSAVTPTPEITAKLAARVGHLLGARRFVQGSFLPLPDERVQLDAGIMDIVGELPIAVSAEEPIQGRLSEILRLEKTLGVAVLEALGVSVDAGVQKALGEPATDDFQAFLFFSRGLVLEDGGWREEAAAAYRRAVERSPSFAEAAERLRITSVGAAEQQDLDRKEIRELKRPSSLPAITGERQIGALGLGPLPDGSGGPADTPNPSDAVRSDPTVRVVIEGDIPGGNP